MARISEIGNIWLPKVDIICFVELANQFKLALTSHFMEVALNVNDNGVKKAGAQSGRVEEWLETQVRKSIEKLNSKPVQRRGPFILSDDDLNETYNIR